MNSSLNKLILSGAKSGISFRYFLLSSPTAGNAAIAKSSMNYIVLEGGKVKVTLSVKAIEKEAFTRGPSEQLVSGSELAIMIKAKII